MHHKNCIWARSFIRTVDGTIGSYLWSNYQVAELWHAQFNKWLYVAQLNILGSVRVDIYS